MNSPFSLWVVLVLLCAWLCARVWRRRRAEAARQRALERECPRNVLNASAILPGIERLRANYAEAMRNRKPPSPAHRGLLAVTRHIVSRLEFFRHTNRIVSIVLSNHLDSRAIPPPGHHQ